MPSQTPDAWGRVKLLAILAGTVAAGLALFIGLGLFVWQVLRDDPAEATDQQDPGGSAAVVTVDEGALPGAGPARREQIAAAGMLQVQDPRAFREGPVATSVVEAIEIPPTTATGPLGVPTGYPRTPEGAVAQLGAIDLAIIQGMSVPATHEVYRAWASGEADPESWVMTGNVADFLTAAQQSGQQKETGLVVTATPAAGQVKGVDGGDWVLACVLLDLRATLVEEARVAYGHCEAMTWQEDRWLIDTTHQVAPAPSTWPGTELAAQAGWRTWAHGDQQDGR